MADDAARLARTLANLERRLKAVERGSQLGRSSVIVNGTPVSLEGTARAVITVAETAAQAVARASSAEAKADGVVVTFYTDDGTPPADPKLGDFWVRRDTQDVATWDGAAWVPVTSSEVKAALLAAQDAQATADGKVSTWFQDEPPVSPGVGDIWYDTNDQNRQRLWDGTVWQDVRDGAILDALDRAADAQGAATTALNAANGKTRVVYSTNHPSSSTPGTNPGDTWFVQNGGGYIAAQYTWTGSAWSATQLTDAMISTLTAGKIVTGTLTAGTTITAGTPGSTRTELGSFGVRAYNGNVQYFSAGTSGFYFRGNVNAELFQSQGALRSTGYVEVGNTGDSDPVDEIRMRTSGWWSSIRNPSDKPGAIRFSLSSTSLNFTNTYDLQGQSFRSNANHWVIQNNGNAGLTMSLSTLYLNAGSVSAFVEHSDSTNYNILFKNSRSGAGGLKLLGTANVVQVHNGSAYGDIKAYTVAYNVLRNDSNPRFKQDIEPVEIDALAALSGTRLCRWKWNPKTTGGVSGPGLGMLTTELPELVTATAPKDEDGVPDNYDVGALIGLLVQAVRQLDARYPKPATPTPPAPELPTPKGTTTRG